MDDLQTIQRLKRGDISALESLVLRYQVQAIRAAFLVIHDEQLAQDVVQDVFLYIYHHIRQFDEDRPFEPYLMRSVVNAALNAVQKTGKHISFDGDLEEIESLLSQAVSVESEVEYTQLKQTIVLALSKLEPRRRTAMIQRYYLEMSEKEMAAALNAPPGTVKWLLNTARAKLREVLGSERGSE